MGRGSLRLIAAAFRRQPVGGVNAAAPGYHYTLDHPLPLETPCKAVLNQNRRPQALARRATYSRPNEISVHASAPSIKRNTGRLFHARGGSRPPSAILSSILRKIGW